MNDDGMPYWEKWEKIEEDAFSFLKEHPECKSIDFFALNGGKAREYFLNLPEDEREGLREFFQPGMLG